MWRPLAGFVGGLLYGLLMMVLAMLPCSFTDKWTAMAWASLPGLVLIPITGILLLIPSTASEVVKMRKVEAARVLVSLILALDVAFVVITINETGPMMKDWPDILLFFLFFGGLWAVPWAYWHCVAIRMAMKRMP